MRTLDLTRLAYADLAQALSRVDVPPTAVAHVLSTGGYSDDCHVLDIISIAVAEDQVTIPDMSEYTPAAVRIDLGDGRSIVLTTTYQRGDWVTDIALPPGVTIRAVALHAEEEEG